MIPEPGGGMGEGAKGGAGWLVWLVIMGCFSWLVFWESVDPIGREGFASLRHGEGSEGEEGGSWRGLPVGVWC